MSLVGNSENQGYREPLALRLHLTAASRPLEELLLSCVCTLVLAEQLGDELMDRKDVDAECF